MTKTGGMENNPSSAPAATGATGSVAKIFVSYASQDVVVADSVCAALEAAGLSCWIAPRDVCAGESYAAAIVQAISDCTLLVLVLSKSAIDSPHVLREVERASSKKRPVLSIRMDATALPPDLEYFLSANHWLDASAGPIERILPALVESVRGRDTGKTSRAMLAANSPAAQTAPPPVASAAPSAAPARGRTRAMTLVLGVVAAGVAYVVADRIWLSKRTAAPEVSNQAAAGMSAKTAASAAATAISDKSIAVLPFTDMSEKKDQEYFSDGLSEELIDLLVKIPGLHVPARTSSFYFKGKSEDIPTIARRLMVAHVLEGSVRKSGNNLRITAQLIRADTGFHLWSETYDRQLNDVFKVQDEIAGAVVEQLKVALLSGPAAPTATASPEAYNLYLQARYFAERDNPEDLDKAVVLYEQAIAIDPNYALAYAWLAQCYARRVANGADTNGVGYAKTRAAAERAIALDPKLPEGYLTLGSARMQYETNWVAAADLLRKAQELDANNPAVLQFAGHLTQATGTLADAETYFRRGIEKDPLNPLLRRYLARALYYEDRLAEAESTLRRLIELNPMFPGVRYELTRVLLARGDGNAALTAIEAEPSTSWKSFGLPLAYWKLHRGADAHTALAAMVANSAGSEFQVAETYAYFGEREQAFHWLEAAHVRHDPGVIWVRRDPLLRALVADPRYKEFLKEMKLPE
jgi:TolB-like protein